jgi:hypothetical protein
MKKTKTKSNPLLIYLFLIVSFGSLFFSTIRQGNAQEGQATTKVHLTILPNVQSEDLPKRKVTFYPQRIFLEEFWENISGKIYKILTVF